MDFSVGVTGGGAAGVVAVVVAVVVDVEVWGAFCCSLAQDAVKPTVATIARPPATAEIRRVRRCDSIVHFHSYGLLPAGYRPLISLTGGVL